MNRRQKFLTIISVMFLLIFMGSSCVQDIITPAYINEDAAAWAGVPTKLFMPYSNLWDAKRLGLAIDYKLTIEKIKAGYYKNITNISIIAGEEIKQIVFDPSGPVGLMLPMLFGGTLGAMAGGRWIKRPEEKELEKKLNGG